MKRYTSSDFASLPISKFTSLPDAELRRAYSDLRSVVNKRLSRLSDKGIASQAMSALESSGGALRPLKGLSVHQVRAEFKRAKSALLNPTSTTEGAIEFVNKINAKTGINLQPEQSQKFFDVYEELKTRNPNAIVRYRESFEVINEIIDDGSVGELANDASDMLREIYESFEQNVGGFPDEEDY